MQSYMNKELLRKAQKKLANQSKDGDEEENAEDSALAEDMESAKKLIDFAQKHQKAKESYKPGLLALKIFLEFAIDSNRGFIPKS